MRTEADVVTVKAELEMLDREVTEWADGRFQAAADVVTRCDQLRRSGRDVERANACRFRTFGPVWQSRSHSFP
ncbi:TPA: hypothetical protein DCE37_16715 [Candidatus Latescibacteria bacterium]|nr:hypothetical protein [Candidatus Latescibacterota bacterium]